MSRVGEIPHPSKEVNMAYSESQKRATMKWDKENYDRVYLTVPKGMKQEIDEVAKSQGYDSMRAFIIDAIKEKMGRN